MPLASVLSFPGSPGITRAQVKARTTSSEGEMSSMRKTAKAVVTGLGAAALVTAAALPAMASGYPEPVSVSVGESVSASGFTPIAFGSGIPGQTLQYSEQYQINTNDPAGFTVQVADTGGGVLTGGQGGATIPDNYIKVQDLASLTTIQLSTTPQTLYANGANTGLNDTWSLTIPPGQAQGNYTGQIQYTVTGN